MLKPLRLNNYALSICVMDYSLIRFFSSSMSILRTSLASATKQSTVSIASPLNLLDYFIFNFLFKYCFNSDISLIT